MQPPIVKLINPIQNYAWGSHDAIARLQGRSVPSPEPEAEVWIGDHPLAPSRVADGDGDDTIALPDWIGRDPAAVLGASGDHLPFLVKLLAAARPLSVQVHPDAEQARAGFERESLAATPVEERCYRDPESKHEVLVALSRFEALCGFRCDADVAQIVGRVPSLERLAREPGNDPVAVRLFHRLQRLSGEERAALSGDLESFAASQRSLEADIAARLLREHPLDPLAAAPLLLNPVVLAQGEALVVEPGTVHSYLSGSGVEVMTRSDNVIRGGLTPKHVDPDELLAVVSSRVGPADVRMPERLGDGPGTSWRTGTDAFALRAFEIDASRPELRRPGGRVAVLFCVAGDLAITAAAGSPAGSIQLVAGEAVLVPAWIEGFQLQGRAPTSKVFEVSAW